MSQTRKYIILSDGTVYFFESIEEVAEVHQDDINS
jgi:hypothetical protein